MRLLPVLGHMKTRKNSFNALYSTLSQLAELIVPYPHCSLISSRFLVETPTTFDIVLAFKIPPDVI